MARSPNTTVRSAAFSALRDWVAWLLELGVERVIMESTGSDFQSVYATLEQAGIPAHVVNAPHVKNVPPRKTDLSDS